MTILDAIEAEGCARGESLGEAVRHHLLLGVVERVARSAHREAFVLRGGLLTREWVGKRPTKDLDYLGDFAFDRADTEQRIRDALLPLPDGVVFGALHSKEMWVESGFPGVKLTLQLGFERADQEITIDVGFRDPLVPPAVERTIARPSGSFPARVVRPETQVAWKLHGLCEMGSNYRPKDLADLLAITDAVALDRETPGAIEIAFTSRGYARSRSREVFVAPHWPTKTARIRWEPYAKRYGSLADVIETLRVRFAPFTEELT